MEVRRNKDEGDIYVQNSKDGRSTNETYEYMRICVRNNIFNTLQHAQDGKEMLSCM
jgi:hypothetical protein